MQTLWLDTRQAYVEQRSAFRTVGLPKVSDVGSSASRQRLRTHAYACRAAACCALSFVQIIALQASCTAAVARCCPDGCPDETRTKRTTVTSRLLVSANRPRSVVSASQSVLGTRAGLRGVAKVCPQHLHGQAEAERSRVRASLHQAVYTARRPACSMLADSMHRSCQTYYGVLYCVGWCSPCLNQ